MRMFLFGAILMIALYVGGLLVVDSISKEPKKTINQGKEVVQEVAGKAASKIQDFGTSQCHQFVLDRTHCYQRPGFTANECAGLIHDLCSMSEKKEPTTKKEPQ